MSEVLYRSPETVVSPQEVPSSPSVEESDEVPSSASSDRLVTIEREISALRERVEGKISALDALARHR